MRFSLYTLTVSVLMAASVMAFVWRFPVWRLERDLPYGSYEQGFSPDGNKVFKVVDQFSDFVAAQARKGTPTGYIHVVDIGSGKIERRIAIPKDVFSFSSDNKYLAWFDPAAHAIRVEETDWGRELNVIPYVPYAGDCTRIEFAYMAPWLFVEDRDRNLTVLSALTAQNARHPEYNGGSAIVYRDNGYSFEEYAIDFSRVLPNQMVYGANPEQLRRGPHTRIQMFPAQRRSVVMLEESAAIVNYDWRTAKLSSIMTIDTSEFRASEAKPLTPLNSPFALSNGPLAHFSFALSQDASLVAIGTDKLRIYRVAEGEPECMRTWDRIDLNEIQFSKDNSRIFIAHTNTNPAATTFSELNIATGEELSYISISEQIMLPIIAANENRVLFQSSSGAAPTRVYIRNHPGGWAGQFYRVETWLTILFSGLLVQRFFVWRKVRTASRRASNIIPAPSTQPE